jgi:hypothetical protein
MRKRARTKGRHEIVGRSAAKVGKGTATRAFAIVRHRSAIMRWLSSQAKKSQGINQGVILFVGRF